MNPIYILILVFVIAISAVLVTLAVKGKLHLPRRSKNKLQLNGIDIPESRGDDSGSPLGTVTLKSDQQVYSAKGQAIKDKFLSAGTYENYGIVPCGNKICVRIIEESKPDVENYVLYRTANLDFDLLG